MNRSAILDGPQASAPHSSTSAPVIHQPPVSVAKVPEATIDLREPTRPVSGLRDPDLGKSDRRESDRSDESPPSPPDYTPARGRVGSGAHDQGLSLEEWLASGEED